MATEGDGRLPFLGAALGAALTSSLAQGAHLAVANDLGPFAAVAFTGMLAPLLVVGAIGLALAAHSARRLAWIDVDPRANLDRFVDWAWRDDVATLGRRTAALIAFGSALLAWQLMSGWVGVQILAAVARPELGIGLLVGSQALLLVPAAAVFAITFHAMRMLLGRARRRAIAAPASLLVASAIASLAGAVAIFFGTDAGRHLPWDVVTATVAAAVGWVVMRRVRQRGALTAVVLAVLAICTALTVKMPDEVRDDRAVFTSTSGVASSLHRALHGVLDRDKDGAIHIFGGGDCAPDDPKIHPDAMEILNNGIDEDCSGSDFDAQLSFDEAARSFGQPTQVRGEPNIVFVTTDSLSFQSTSLGRTDRDTTPNLAKWARQRGVVYDAAFANGPSTRLAFPSIMASMFNSSIGMRRIRSHPYAWSDDTPTIAAALGRAGYRTVMVTPDAYFSRRWKKGVSQGFDIVDHSPMLKPKDKIHTAPEVTEATIKQMRAARASGKPVFLWTHYYDHHSPFRLPAGGKVFGTKTVDIFDSEVHFADQHWGRLFQAIDTELGEDTIVIFTSDHGESFDEFHQKKHHGHDLRTPVLWVPMIISAPGVTARTSHGLVSHADIPPTIADLAGLSRDPQWMGESLVPTLWDGKEAQKTVVYGLFYLPERHKQGDPFSRISVRTNDWYYERHLWTGAQRLTKWREDVSGKHDLAGEQRETTDVLRQLALLKLDALQKKERGLSAEE